MHRAKASDARDLSFSILRTRGPGTGSWSQVTSAAAGEAAYEVSSKFKKAPPAKLKARTNAGVALLRLEVARAIEAFSAEFKTKVI